MQRSVEEVAKDLTRIEELEERSFGPTESAYLTRALQTGIHFDAFAAGLDERTGPMCGVTTGKFPEKPFVTNRRPEEVTCPDCLKWVYPSEHQG